ncbi:golgin subfamily B member 1-like [Dorcoceras hygrometricum]|uniref:Golgin subfamily B member 1-like n=1 Tax=Dorcoceras hygrometricum TaxID=472368 RepID=A0A2Z7CSZ5_9LAMI|nr:golgin subfamily B member 1-like [Dorcoceras hygrometricum]
MRVVTVSLEGTEIAAFKQTANEKISTDEAMTLEEILLTIPDGCSLPSTTGEVTKIQLGKSIQFRDFNKWDWYKASLPKISTAEKGKAPLHEKDPIKGNPTKEIFSLICADIDLLVQLREQVIDEVDRFFNSFSFKKLAALKLEEIYAKEELVLTWAETDSTKVALQRRTYILLKYRELLLRKFLETRQSNFVSGTPSSAIDLQVLDKVSDLHLFVLEELKVQVQAHGLRWKKTCCSKIFEGKNRDRGVVITRSNPNIKSSCWIRTMIRVSESWVIEPCADYWKPLPRQVVCNEVLPQFSYVDTLPTVSEFFKMLKKRWADVCLEAAEFFVSGTLLPVGSLNFCRALALVKPAPEMSFRQPTITSWGWSQLCTAFVRNSLFGGLQTVDISKFLSVLVPVRPFLRDTSIFNSVVQLAPQSHLGAGHNYVQLLSETVYSGVCKQLISHSDSDSSSSSHDLMYFHVSSPMDKEFVDTSADGTAPDPTQISLPPPVNQLSLPVSTNVSASFVELRASISRLVSNQTRDSRKLGDSHGKFMSKINHLERALLDSLAAQDQAFRGLIKNIRQEAHNDTDVLSLALKAVRAQNAILSTDIADVRKEVKDQRELFKEMDEQIATVRSELLDFRAQAQENHLNLSTQLGFLVDYINRGGDAKKGEGGSSRPQPPPDDQNRPSGGNASRSSGGGSGGSKRKDDRGSGSKKRHCSGGSGGGSYGPYGPYIKDAEYWLFGKNQF